MLGLYYLVIFCLGLAAGSFVNSWVWRTRENLDITNARSICPDCRCRLCWYDNIPLVSFFCLGGRCRRCRRRISWQYPLVELWGGFVFLGAAIFHRIGPFVLTTELVRDWLIVVFLTFNFLYDLNYRELTNFHTVLPGVVLFIFSLGLGWKSGESLIFGVLIGTGFFLLLYFISKGAWIGGGDVRLGFFMGVILGWPAVLVGLLVAYIVGAVWSLGLMALQRKTLKSETPFGTYLALGTIVAMFGGGQLAEWYVKLL